MAYQDASITCAECGRTFVYSAGEQAYHAEQGFSGAPRRCPECRAAPPGEQAGATAGARTREVRRQPAPMANPAPVFSGRRFDKFTERAKKVLVLAQEEARRFDHNYIGTEHILLGLVGEGEGIAAKILGNLGVELEKVRASVEFMIGRGDRRVQGDISLAPRVKKVIELAVDESRRLGHNHVGTEHLLLGLVIEGEGIAAGILESLGVALDGVRDQVLRVVGAPGGRAAEPAPAARNNVLSCRVDDADLAAIDTLLEAGVCTTRSEAASWLIHAGIQANRAVFEQVESTVATIRRLRGQAQSLAQRALDTPGADPAPDEPAPPEPPAPGPEGDPGAGPEGGPDATGRG